MSADGARGGDDDRITRGDHETNVEVPEELEHAARRIKHADIPSSEIAEDILELTE
jgi:hypothetical protein